MRASCRPGGSHYTLVSRTRLVLVLMNSLQVGSPMAGPARASLASMRSSTYRSVKRRQGRKELEYIWPRGNVDSFLKLIHELVFRCC